MAASAHNFPVNCGGHLQAKSTVPMGMQVPEFWQGFGVHLLSCGSLCGGAGGEKPTGVVGERPGCKPTGGVGGLSPKTGFCVGGTTGK